MDPRITFVSLFSLSLLTCYISASQEAPAPVVVEIQPTVIASKPESAMVAKPEVAKGPEKRTGVSQDEAEARMLVFQGHTPMLALQRVDEKEWLQGEPKWLSRSQPFELTGAVNEELLSSSTKAWVGKTVDLYKADGSTCTAEVTKLSLFGQLNSYSEEQPGAAKDTWELAQNIGGVRVVGELSLDRCEGAIFARLASLPNLEVARPQEPTAALREEVLIRGRQLALYQNIQREFEEYKKEQKITEKLWENLYEARPEVKLFSLNGQSYAMLSIDAGEGCGSFAEGLFALWTLEEGKINLVQQNKDWANPELIFDLNHDGNIELIEDKAISRMSDDQFEQTTDATIADDGDGCGC